MGSNEGPFVSVIIPCRNEEKYIGQVLSDLIKQDYGIAKMEILVADAMSSDGTRSIINKTAEQYPLIKVLDNPRRHTPVALNIAIKASVGDPIIRIDAHTRYEPDYISKIIETFRQTGADIAGGPMRPVGDNVLQKAIAYATTTSFGIGDSRFHDENYKGYVDSVYLGAWRRNIFGEVGYFDENLVRNQDDEFHYRAKSRGKKIYLDPEIKSWYYPRSGLGPLVKQYFQYGLYKPYVLRKIKSEIKLRHLVPVMFVLYLLSLPFAVFFPVWAVPAGMYALLDMYASLINRNTLQVKLASLIVFPLIHISYGAGFIAGLFKKTGTKTT